MVARPPIHFRMLALELLHNDHRAAEELLVHVNELTTRRAQAELLLRLWHELQGHVHVEESGLYPIVERVDAARAAVEQARRQHRDLMALVAELVAARRGSGPRGDVLAAAAGAAATAPADEADATDDAARAHHAPAQGWAQRVAELCQRLHEHVAYEESMLFPHLHAVVGGADAARLAERWREERHLAPFHPPLAEVHAADAARVPPQHDLVQPAPRRAQGHPGRARMSGTSCDART